MAKQTDWLPNRNTAHEKRKSGRFRHLPRRRPAQMKLSSMRTPTSPAPHRLSGIIPPPLCLSFVPALHVSVFPPLFHLELRYASSPLLPAERLSHRLSTPYVNLFPCFSLFHYHYLTLPLSFPSSLFLVLVPSLCSIAGRMRCFNESVLSPSLERVDID